jgi:putative protease
MSEEKLQEVGVIAHYFPKISVAVIELKGAVQVGDIIQIVGATTNFEQPITSIEVEHKKIEKANAGDSIGLKVEERVREKDIVYKKLA